MNPKIRKVVEGMKFDMYTRHEHPLPHVHVKYGEHRATFAIEDGRLLVGKLPRRKLALAQEWIRSHTEELLEMWESRFEPGGIHEIDD